MVIERGEFSPNTARLTTCRAGDIVAHGEKGGFKFLFSFSREKTTADLADEARKWTLVVECWR